MARKTFELERHQGQDGTTVIIEESQVTPGETGDVFLSLASPRNAWGGHLTPEEAKQVGRELIAYANGIIGE